MLASWIAFARGRETGRAVGESVANRQCGFLVAAASWANTPDGQRAYALAMVLSDRGRALARWPLTPSASRNSAEAP